MREAKAERGARDPAAELPRRSIKRGPEGFVFGFWFLVFGCTLQSPPSQRCCGFMAAAAETRRDLRVRREAVRLYAITTWREKRGLRYWRSGRSLIELELLTGPAPDLLELEGNPRC